MSRGGSGGVSGNFAAHSNGGTFNGNTFSRSNMSGPVNGNMSGSRMGRMDMDHDRGRDHDHDGRFRGRNFAFGFSIRATTTATIMTTVRPGLLPAAAGAYPLRLALAASVGLQLLSPCPTVSI